MNALSRTLQSASQQFIANAQPVILTPKTRAIVMASALAVLAGVSVSPSARAQYVWGNGGQSAATQDGTAPPVVSQGSVSRWGELLGGVVGRVAGSSIAGGAATSVIGRTVQDAAASVAEEAGRNLGRSAVTPSTSRTVKVLPLAESDYIDTAGLNALFAHGQAARAVLAERHDSVDTNALLVARARTLREFDLAIRTSAGRGFDVAPWSQALALLQRPVGSTPESQLVQQGQAMSDRLYRAGGPGYRVPTEASTTSLERMRINMQARSQPAPGAADAPR